MCCFWGHSVGLWALCRLHDFPQAFISGMNSDFIIIKVNCWRFERETKRVIFPTEIEVVGLLQTTWLPWMEETSWPFKENLADQMKHDSDKLLRDNGPKRSTSDIEQHNVVLTTTTMNLISAHLYLKFEWFYGFMIYLSHNPMICCCDFRKEIMWRNLGRK